MTENFFLLGSGAKAFVYLGMNKMTGCFVAVKELSVPLDDDAEALSILSEVQHLRSISHPNIVKCFGAKGHFDKIQIVMEYCPGGSVARTLRHFGAFSESVCRRIIKGAASGLAYLHERNICHRDIKLENLLLTVDGACKLGDLGSSKGMPQEGGLVTCVGTPQYMAPEVINGGGDDEKNGYGTAADIWSLGCCIYEMLTGEAFVKGSNPLAIMFLISEKANMPFNIPEEIKISKGAYEVLERCLCVDYNSRITASSLLNHPWLSEQLSNEEFIIDDVIVPTGHENYSNLNHESQVVSHFPPRELEINVNATLSCTKNCQKIGHQGFLYSSDFEELSDQNTKSSGSLPLSECVSTRRQAQSAFKDLLGTDGKSRDVSAFSNHLNMTMCQKCRVLPALLECDTCRNISHGCFQLCPLCWPKIHKDSGSHHIKRPLLLKSSNLETPSDTSGVLLRNGAFVDLSLCEESGWSCGSCHTYNEGVADKCGSCGQSN